MKIIDKIFDLMEPILYTILAFMAIFVAILFFVMAGFGVYSIIDFLFFN